MLYTVTKLAAVLVAVEAGSTSSTTSTGSTCRDIKAAYQGSSCCSSNLAQTTTYTVEKSPSTIWPGVGANPCAGKKPSTVTYFDNINCTAIDGVSLNVLEQAGANITAGYVGGIDTGPHRQPINSTLFEAGLCPVNVHWHAGAEHYSAGEFDEYGTGPASSVGLGGTHPGRRLETFESNAAWEAHAQAQFDEHGRRLGASGVRMGFQCRHYNAADPKFTTPYEWKYCSQMVVGQTYEVHWPHSAAGACHTADQYQSPFYDGVFCRDGIISLSPLNTFTKIGVHGQVFTIVNDENYYYPDLIRGMIVDAAFGSDVAMYTGSTTGTSRNNDVCSRYTPITWHVDRKCHMVSASSFDKMCKDMLAQRDDMSSDTHPHGARELVADFLAANNLQRR